MEHRAQRLRVAERPGHRDRIEGHRDRPGRIWSRLTGCSEAGHQLHAQRRRLVAEHRQGAFQHLDEPRRDDRRADHRAGCQSRPRRELRVAPLSGEIERAPTALERRVVLAALGPSLREQNERVPEDLTIEISAETSRGFVEQRRCVLWSQRLERLFCRGCGRTHRRRCAHDRPSGQQMPRNVAEGAFGHGQAIESRRRSVV
jgi:hypothetical protein